MKTFLNLFFITCITIILFFTGSANINTSSSNYTITLDSLNCKIYNVDSNEIKLESLTTSLLNEVTSYIRKYHKTCSPDIPQLFVKYGLDYNIDICFMMSQAKIETCFGKGGIGRINSKKSLFGVISRRYGTYDEAFSHYVNTLNKYYLTGSRTEQDLMRKYTTKRGTRYAGNPNYEVELRKTYNTICTQTNIRKLQAQINNLLDDIKNTRDPETTDTTVLAKQ